MKSIFSEFREFAVKGNMIDLAVGVVIGTAFQAIINSLVNDILMPPIGALTGRADFKDLFVNLSSTPVSSIAEAKTQGIPTLNYGQFINQLVTFFIVAWCLFLIVKLLNRMRRERERKEAKSAKK